MWFSKVPKKSTHPQLLDYWMKGNVVDNIKIKHDSSEKTYNKINNFKPCVLSKVNKSSKNN